jgi:hypothetical protein
MFDNILEEKYEMSLAKIMLIFYILASSSALFPLLSKQLKESVENNRFVRHIIGFTTILALVLLVSNGKFSTLRIMIYTGIAYLWFILSTKIDLQWNVMIIVSLLAFLLYQNDILNTTEHIDNNVNLSSEEKNNIIKTNKNNYVYITGVIILATIAGTLLYTEKKEQQYGGGYSLFNFLLN